MVTPTHTTAAIGESLLESSQSYECHAEDPHDEQVPPTKQCNPSLLSAALSIGATGGVQLDSDSEEPAYILLQGPDQSGRSSLAMDIAVEVASNAPCRCNSRLCTCLPVAFLRPESKADSFPTRCRRYGADDSGVEFRQRIQHLSKPANTSRDDAMSWNPNVLRRIQVHHLVSFRDCLQYLLSLQGKPQHEQPFGAIIIDDIDCLSGDDLEAHEGTMQVAQFLAILFDTINFLNFRPLLCVTMNKKSNFPTDCFMASLFTSVVTVQGNSSDQGSSWEGVCEDTNDVVLSSWSTCVKQRGSTKPRKHLDYIMCRMDNENHRIYWRTHEL